MSYAYILDLLVAVLLATTIVWCVLLNRRLKGLRQNQGELASLIAELNLATSRAEAGISVLRVNTEEAGLSLQSSIDRAERLNDDLAYLSERGARLVERLDGPTKSARRSAFAGKKSATVDMKGSGPEFGKADGGPDFGTRDPARKTLEKKLLDALKAAQ